MGLRSNASFGCSPIKLPKREHIMEWTITIKEEQYVEIVTRGIADKNGSLAMAQAIATAMRENSLKKALIDQSNIDEVSGSVIDVYQRPKQFQEMGVVRGLMIAEVVKPKHKEFFKFLETVSVNRGIMFATFNDRKSALDWLLNQ